MSKIWYDFPNSRYRWNKFDGNDNNFEKTLQKNCRLKHQRRWFQPLVRNTGQLLILCWQYKTPIKAKKMTESTGNKRNISRTISLIYKWYQRFSHGVNNLGDATRSGRLLLYGKNTPYLLRCHERQDVLR